LKVEDRKRQNEGTKRSGLAPASMLVFFVNLHGSSSAFKNKNYFECNDFFAVTIDFALFS